MNTNGIKEQVAPENLTKEEQRRKEEAKKKKAQRNKIIVWIIIALFLLLGVFAYLYYENTKPLQGFDGVNASIEAPITLEVESNPKFKVSEMTPVCNAISNTSLPIENLKDFVRLAKESESAGTALETGRIILPNIATKFTLGSADVSDDFKLLVEEYAKAFLKTNRKAQIVVDGYACNIGADDVNMSLSKKRAEVIKSLLISSGVPENSVKLNWFGKNKNSEFTYSNIEDYRRVNIHL